MPDIPDADYRTLAQLRFEIRSFLAFSEAAARDACLEPRHHQLLLLLRGLPPALRPTIRTVAERLLIRHHSAVELVDRATAQGLVERTRSPHDGREVWLRLTPQGEALLAGLTRAHRDELAERGPRLIAGLRALLEGAPGAEGTDGADAAALDAVLRGTAP